MSTLDASQLFNVAGKVVLVTGGSRGIGKMIAAGFVQNGAKVYITSRSQKACEETAKELNSLPASSSFAQPRGSCIPIPADLQKLSEVERLVDEVQKHELAIQKDKTSKAKIHVLVNNAGTAWAEDIDDYADAAFTKVLTLNLQRVFSLTQKCLPLLREAALEGGRDGSTWKDPARIINIGSIDGLRVPLHQTFAYSASKAGLHQLSRHLASQLGWEGITSNAIACGPFQSKMMAQTLETTGDLIISAIPLTRIGTPEDVAGTALFLASRAGAYVNGATIELDGGAIVSTIINKGATAKL